jgi:hypothetical protein
MLVLLALNVPLMIVFFGLWVGVPTWLLLRHPDKNPVTFTAQTIRHLSELRPAHRRAA